MNPTGLSLARSRSSAPVAAWLIPGDDPAEWLQVLASLDLPMATLRLHVVPRGVADRAPAALLVLPGTSEPGTKSAGAAAARPGRALPLARIGRSLFVPCDSRLVPPADPAELDALLAHPVHLLHPVHGFVGFEASDAFGIEDLLAAPARSGAAWDAAEPGVRPARLVDVRPVAPPDAVQAIEEGRGDVGTKHPGTLADGPSAPTRGVGDRVGDWIAERVLRFTRDAPRTAKSRTWVNDAEDWATRRLRQNSVSRREQSIERLLHLLRTDPDEGIRFALPIGGPPGRGVAESRGDLSRGDADFRASDLDPSGPVAPWSVDAARTGELRRLYREEAERSLRLGRARRAAYIHARLLQDVRGAAAALESGGHWREAAALYRDRLKDATAAARCLERAGLLSEAIPVYREIGDHASVARLLRRIGRAAEADDVWRLAATARRDAGDVVGAARIHLDELRSPDDALRLLDDGPPGASDAAPRLALALDILGRLGRSAGARRWIRRAKESPGLSVVAVAEVLGAASVTFADPAVRSETASTVREMVAAEIRSPQSVLDRRLAAAIGATDPQDRVLRADLERFRRDRATTARGIPRTRTPAARASRATRPDIVLPDVAAAAVAIVLRRAGLFVLGESLAGDTSEFRVLDRSSGAVAARVSWDTGLATTGRPVVIVDSLRRRVCVAWTPGPRLPERAISLPGADARPWTVGTPSWLLDGTLALCEGDALSAWSVRPDADAGGILMTCHSMQGLTLRHAVIAQDAPLDAIRAVDAACVRRDAYFTAGGELFRVDRAGAASRVATGAFAALHAHAGPGGDALLEVGEDRCRIRFDPAGASRAVAVFAEETESPRACFLADGRVVVADRTSLAVYARDRHRMRGVHSEAVAFGVVRAVLRGTRDDEVIVATDAPAVPGGVAGRTGLRLMFRGVG